MFRMATYTVIPKVDHTGFHVAIVGSNGVRQTILGFDTRADAEAWILRDKLRIPAKAATYSNLIAATIPI